MGSTAQLEPRPAAEVIRNSPVAQAANGVCYATVGDIYLPTSDIERMVAAVPRSVAAALARKAYYFVPLTVSEGDQTLISERYDAALSERAICHRNFAAGDSQVVFISTRLMEDRFAVAFEFFINVGHAFVETAGVAPGFADLVWKQVDDRAKGETSLDAWEFRKQAASSLGDVPRTTPMAEAVKQGQLRIDEKAKTEYFNATFSDALAIYMLSLYIDVDYYDLRERDYPLLAPAQLAERLRKVASLFPADPGFEFNIFYRRRG